MENKRYTREDIERIVEEENVEFIRLQFTDIFGTLKNVAITKNNLSKALDNRFLFDGTYINGFDTEEESDMFLYPDLDTFEIFPWRPQSGKVARLICDVYTTDGEPLFHDPRRILKKVLKEQRDNGIVFNIGPECEFFLFQTDDQGRPTTDNLEDDGYLDLGHSDMGENVRRDMVFTLEDMNFDIESSYHEKGKGQHEIDFKYVDALNAADDIMTFKLAVKNIAKKHGLIASFMPKPIQDAVGSGMHINVSLNEYGDNIFYDENDENKLSEKAYQFIAGVLKHLKGMSLITNPIVNSYKRLQGGKYVPNNIAFASKGKKAAIRTPYIKGREHARIEIKSPDATCNPYLAIAVIIAAGMDGINNKLDYREYDLEKAENIEKLPVCMGEAIEAFEKDDFIRGVIGDYVSEKYIEQKKIEWHEYLGTVSNWELDKYFMRG
ncbi:MAG: glutamine synthetase family protein [Lachnospiraceae bacterium]|nr:glutamine synthetase family protein [Lachnospiraceae bacterium]